VYKMQGSWFRVEVGVQGLGSRVQGIGYRVASELLVCACVSALHFLFRASGLGCRVSDARFRVWFRSKGLRV
jgi:hypothetical protein